MKTVPNQRTIKTNKEPCNKNNLYTQINLKALQQAMNTLKPTTFEMWLYMAKNQNNYPFALSKVDCLQWCNFSESTYSTAFKELVNTGYLIQSKEDSNHYDFYETPQEKGKEKPTATTDKAANGFRF